MLSGLASDEEISQWPITGIPKRTACFQRAVGTEWSLACALRSGTATWGAIGEFPSGVQTEDLGFMLCHRAPSNQGTIRVAMYADPLKQFIEAYFLLGLPLIQFDATKGRDVHPR